MKDQRIKQIAACMSAAVLLATLSGCPPDPEPMVPDNLGINMPDPDMNDPDMGEPDPDMERPTEDMDRPTEDMDRPTEDMDRPTEDSGMPDMAATDMGSDPCDGVDCGDGSCVELGGEASCACPAGFVGDDCSECLAGYAGPNCDECAPGYLPDPLGSTGCVPDPCAGDPCNSAGTCIGSTDPTGAGFTCRCDTGFTGDTCDTCADGYEGTNCDTCSAGYVMENGECVILACSPIPCTDKGTCVDADGDGMAECVCEEGWTGRDCGTCATNYVLDVTTGECILDVCLNVTCVNGTCLPSAAGPIGYCECEEGYEGDACDQCAYGYSLFDVGGQMVCLNDLPVRDSRVTGWFDASSVSDIILEDGDRVNTWGSRLGSTYLNAWFVDTTLRPRYIAFPEPAVEFDGTHAMSSGWGFIEKTDAYSVFAVVTWKSTSMGEHIVKVSETGQEDTRFTVTVSDDTVAFTHDDRDSNNGGPDVAELSTFDPSVGAQLIAIQRSPFLNGQAMSVSDGVDETVLSSSEENMDGDTLTLIGLAGWSGGVPHQALNGRIHELIFVNGTLTVAERAQIISYLEVKWGL